MDLARLGDRASLRGSWRSSRPSLAVARSRVAAGVKVEGVGRFRREAARAGRELDTFDDVADTGHDSGLKDLAARGVQRNLGDVAFRVDRPLDDQVALDARVVLQRFFVTTACLVAVRNDNGSDILRAAAGIV